MDTIQIIKKAFRLVWRYRAKWIFGVFLALTMKDGLWLGLSAQDDNLIAENRIILANKSTIYFPGHGLTIDFRTPADPQVSIEGLDPDWYQDLTQESSLSDLWVLLISIGVVLLINTFLSVLLRYTSEAALISMVDEYEHSEQMISVGQSFRLGWSRIAGKLFLIDLSILLPVILVFSLLFFLAASPLFILGW